MNDGSAAGAGTTCSIAAEGRQFLTQMAEQLTSGAVHEAMQNLFLWLSCQRTSHRRDKGQWSAFTSDCLRHPIAALLHQDPLTWRTFHKPKGYAGDATMLDLAATISADDIGNMRLFTEADQNLLFLQITKKA
jgi:hypothetical protein